MTLSNQRAIVTGATQGIGRAIVDELIRCGIPVGLIARDPDRLAACVDSIRQQGGEAHGYVLDLTQVEALPQALATIVEDFGECSILINNAGMAHVGPLASTSLADWQRIMSLNVTAALACMQAVIPGMRHRHQGTIINMISIAGKQTFPNWGAYCASKFALLALSRALAQEEAANGIRVTSICPGAVATPLWDSVAVDFDRGKMLSPETVAALVMQAILLPPEAVLEEIVLMPAVGTL
ncbi:MAG: SDR family oxidoreductase [Synechococcales cyanobacterium]